MARDDEAMRRWREQQKRERDAQIQANLDAAAAEEEQLQKYNTASDQAFEDAFKDILGYSTEDVRRYVDKADDVNVGRLLGDISKAGKAGKNDKVRKLLRKNKRAIKAAAKEGKSKDGCAVVGLLLVGGTTAFGWAVVELLS